MVKASLLQNEGFAIAFLFHFSLFLFPVINIFRSALLQAMKEEAFCRQRHKESAMMSVYRSVIRVISGVAPMRIGMVPPSPMLM